MLYNFKSSEIESIVKVIIENKKYEEEYGYTNDEYEFPVLIEQKLDKLGVDEYENLINICEDIAQNVEDVLSGELNMLHKLHEEIKIIVDEYIANGEL